VIDEDGPLLLF